MEEKNKKLNDNISIKEEVIKTKEYQHLYETVPEDNKKEFLEKLDEYSESFQPIQDMIEAIKKNPKLKEEFRRQLLEKYGKK